MLRRRKQHHTPWGTRRRLDTRRLPVTATDLLFCRHAAGFFFRASGLPLSVTPCCLSRSVSEAETNGDHRRVAANISPSAYIKHAHTPLRTAELRVVRSQQLDITANTTTCQDFLTTLHSPMMSQLTPSSSSTTRCSRQAMRMRSRSSGQQQRPSASGSKCDRMVRRLRTYE